ncbi:hypothetical protein G6F68_018756 [Rhizopus microsporus]|nr:hypothetical protein G6F68_018756 [Rhizopus microsporus]
MTLADEANRYIDDVKPWPGPEPVPRAGHRTEAGAAGHRRAGRGLPGCAGERLDRPGAAAAGPPHHRLHPAVHPYRPDED